MIPQVRLQLIIEGMRYDAERIERPADTGDPSTGVIESFCAFCYPKRFGRTLEMARRYAEKVTTPAPSRSSGGAPHPELP